MSVTGKKNQLLSVLPIPDSDRIVIRPGEDPRHFMMELDCSDEVNVAIKLEHLSIVYHIITVDCGVVASCYE